MSDIRFKCPLCQAPLQIAEEGAGIQINCPHCSGLITPPQKPRRKGILFLGLALGLVALVAAVVAYAVTLPPPTKPSSSNVRVLDEASLKAARAWIDCSWQGRPTDGHWHWRGDAMMDMDLRALEDRYPMTFRKDDTARQIVPTGDFYTLVVSRNTPRGYADYQIPLLVIGQSVEVPDTSERSLELLRGFKFNRSLVKPVVRDEFALGKPKLCWNVGKNPQALQIEDLDVFAEFPKAGVARYLFYTPATATNFTLIFPERGSVAAVRFSISPKESGQ